MFHNIKIKIMLILLIAIIYTSIISFPTTVLAKEDNEQIVSLYCWEIGDFNLSKLKDEVEYLKVNTLYIQKPSNNSEIDRLKQIMEFAKQYNLDVFLLDGARDWLTTGDMNHVTSLINQAYKLNQILEYKLKGVSLDVEFYLTDDYQSGDYDRQLELFKIFTENTKKCCDYANNHGLEYSMALPVWLNKLSEEVLEDLMNYNYDHIAFMNYFKETIMENIDEEVEIAKKHNIKIVSIAEVQNPKYGTVGEEDTFYPDGLQKCIDTLNAIKQKYNYENLGISYHYYKPLLELLERDTKTGIENKYELEVYPYINGKNINVKEATVTINNTTFEPIHGYHNEKEEHIISFYGLEYGKEYTLTIKNENFMATKTFTYQKNNKDLDELEIAYMKVMLEEYKQPEKDDLDKQEQNNPNNGENKTDENEPNKNSPEQTKPNENEPNKNTPQTTKPEENNLQNKDNTVAPNVIPQTGESYLIEKILIIFTVVMFVLVIVNKMKNK